MGQAFNDGMTLLVSQSKESLLAMFWFIAIFEFPRYTLSFLSVFITSIRTSRSHHLPPDATYSVVIAGHNEADAIEGCVIALHEQSRPPDEIIVVSDGSTDRMAEKVRQLEARGLIKEGHSTQLRAGKSAGVNLACLRATGEFIINIDCDCSFDRHAFKEILEPFTDPQVAGVAGNIVVRNARKTVITAFQAIEYVISISQGKQAANLADTMTCVSGAFGAFRATALKSVGGLDSGGGEDLDVTLNLRKAGWRALFAPDALCYTDVPATLTALTRQRFRWERDAVRLRYRKHVDFLNPFSPRFTVRELIHELEFMLFNVAAVIAFPFYIGWLFVTYGEYAPLILVAAQVGLLALDLFTFALAAWLSPKVACLSLLPYVPGYSLFYGLYMRFVRLAAYLQEWVFQSSYQDSYVPAKVHKVRK